MLNTTDWLLVQRVPEFSFHLGQVVHVCELRILMTTHWRTMNLEMHEYRRYGYTASKNACVRRHVMLNGCRAASRLTRSRFHFILDPRSRTVLPTETQPCHLGDRRKRGEALLDQNVLEGQGYIPCDCRASNRHNPLYCHADARPHRVGPGSATTCCLTALGNHTNRSVEYGVLWSALAHGRGCHRKFNRARDVLEHLNTGRKGMCFANDF